VFSPYKKLPAFHNERKKKKKGKKERKRSEYTETKRAAQQPSTDVLAAETRIFEKKKEFRFRPIRK
jgi:hypothetical protein